MLILVYRNYQKLHVTKYAIFVFTFDVKMWWIDFLSQNRYEINTKCIENNELTFWMTRIALHRAPGRWNQQPIRCFQLQVWPGKLYRRGNVAPITLTNPLWEFVLPINKIGFIIVNYSLQPEAHKVKLDLFLFFCILLPPF